MRKSSLSHFWSTEQDAGNSRKGCTDSQVRRLKMSAPPQKTVSKKEVRGQERGAGIGRVGCQNGGSTKMGTRQSRKQSVKSCTYQNVIEKQNLGL